MWSLLTCIKLRSPSRKWSNTHWLISCVAPARESAPIWLRDLPSRLTPNPNSRGSFQWQWVMQRSGDVDFLRVRPWIHQPGTTRRLAAILCPYLRHADQSERKAEVNSLFSSSIPQLFNSSFPSLCRVLAVFPPRVRANCGSWPMAADGQLKPKFNRVS